jgi:hypothetical protein
MEVTMTTGVEFIRRMQEDAEFRQQVQAQPREERLTFLRNEGYDFSPYIQILNNLSSGRRTPWERPYSGGRGIPGKQTSKFLDRIRQLLFPFPFPWCRRRLWIRVRTGVRLPHL